VIKAVLWDFGGVITTSPFEAFNRYEVEHGIPLNFIRGINATNPENNAWALFESSRVTYDDFNRLFHEETSRAGHPIAGRDVLARLSGDLRPRMVYALKECKRHFKIGCITNNVKSGQGPRMAQTRERAHEIKLVMELFDVVVESSKEGIRKPNPEIYRLAMSRLEVDAGQVVFLDDLGINLKPARELGMQTIKVVNENQALEELKQITGLTF
jgi:putative hydrolase of the HAD superfamily